MLLYGFLHKRFLNFQVMEHHIFLLAFLGSIIGYVNVEGKNKDCMLAMWKVMEAQTKLIVPCIESLGELTQGIGSKENNKKIQNILNATFNFQDEIKLDIRQELPTPTLFKGLGFLRKFKRIQDLLTYFLQCSIKCVMIKAKMLSEDGTVDLELVQKILEELPDALKERARDVVKECGTYAVTLDPTEASCESYRDFVGCMWDVVLKMCDD